MYKDLTTAEVVEIDPSTSPVTEGKPISKVYEVSFRNDQVSITGRFEGDANKQWNTTYTREELPSEDAQGLYDAVIQAVDSLHLAIRQQSQNYKTSDWVEVVEETEE